MIRANRMKEGEKILHSEKEMKSMERDSLDWRMDYSSTVAFIRWHDGGVVQLAFTFARIYWLRKCKVKNRNKLFTNG